MAQTDWSRTVTNGARNGPRETSEPVPFGQDDHVGQGLEHLVYDAALDNSLWPQLLLELINQMTNLQSGSPDCSGEVEDIHPARRKLAGRVEGTLYDRLLAVQADLVRGPMGTDKPMSLGAAVLARLAARRPDTPEAMAAILNERQMERFAEAFLEVMRER